MMDITYTVTAQRDLKKIGHVAAAKVTTKIKAYADNPAGMINQVKKLKGIEALRLRVGNYRVLFTEDRVVMNVERIGHRKDIYD